MSENFYLVCAKEELAQRVARAIRQKAYQESGAYPEIEILTNPEEALKRARELTTGTILVGENTHQMYPVNVIAGMCEQLKKSAAHTKQPQSVRVYGIGMSGSAQVDEKIVRAGGTGIFPLEAKPQLTLATSNPHAHRAKGKVVLLCSGQGTVGKSSLALLLAGYAAKKGVQTALLELDAQFGVLKQYAGVEDTRSVIACCKPEHEQKLDQASLLATGIPLTENCTLFAASNMPEQAELLWNTTQPLIRLLKETFELVVIDAPPVWNEALVNAMEAAEKILVLGEEKAGNEVALKRALGLIGRLGIERTKVSVLINKSVRKRRDQSYLSRMNFVLGTQHMSSLTHGGPEVDAMAQQGTLLHLLDLENRFAHSVSQFGAVLCEELGLLREQAGDEAGKPWRFGSKKEVTRCHY